MARHPVELEIVGLGNWVVGRDQRRADSTVGEECSQTHFHSHTHTHSYTLVDTIHYPSHQVLWVAEGDGEGVECAA
jgi:hypothetical protein